jgi:hypothetical protein
VFLIVFPEDGGVFLNKTVVTTEKHFGGVGKFTFRKAHGAVFMAKSAPHGFVESSVSKTSPLSRIPKLKICI